MGPPGHPDVLLKATFGSPFSCCADRLLAGSSGLALYSPAFPRLGSLVRFVASRDGGLSGPLLLTPSVRGDCRPGQSMSGV